MGTHKGISIIKKQGGLGRREPNTDSTFGIIFGGVAASGLSLDTPAKLIQISDAEALGIDADYDSTNNVLVYHHISEFFRLAPNGTLYIMLTVQGTTLTEMVDKDEELLKKLILSDVANREIKYCGVVMNPASDYVETLSGGLDADVLSAVPKAQELLDSLRADNILVDGIVIEGVHFNGTAADATDLRSLASENVNVVIAQEPGVYDIDSYSAAVGSVLGMAAARKVSENWGSVDIINKPDTKKGSPNYPLTDAANALWLSANLSSGLPVSDYSNTDLAALKAKGYIIAAAYENYPYIYLNGGMTCTAISSDFYSAERNRVWNKAARYVIAALTPKINSKVKIDAGTGYIAPVTIANWEAVTNAEVSKLLADDDVSAVSVSINPEQNVLGGSPIVVQIAVTPDGIAEQIVGEIGLVNPF